MRRCFIALEFQRQCADELRQAAQPLVKALKADKPRFLKQADYHITLKFLGNTEQRRLDALTSALKSALTILPTLETQWAGFGGLPGRSKAHVLVGVLRDDDQRLAQLQQKVEAICSDLMFPTEPRSFKPHVTLARFKKAVDLRQQLSLARTPPSSVQLNSVALYNSTLLPGGAKYSILQRFEFIPNDGLTKHRVNPGDDDSASNAPDSG